MAAAYGTRLPRFATYLVAFLITGLPRFVLFAIGVPLWVILAMCVIGGASSGFLNPVLGAVTFERIPREMVGRVTALNSALCWSLMPFGGVLGGLLVSGIGLSPAMLVVGVRLLRHHHGPGADPELPRDEPPGRPRPARAGRRLTWGRSPTSGGRTRQPWQGTYFLVAVAVPPLLSRSFAVIFRSAFAFRCLSTIFSPPFGVASELFFFPLTRKDPAPRGRRRTSTAASPCGRCS